MNYEQMNNNKVYLRGEVVQTPVFSHEVFDEKFYEFDMKVQRLSDSFDTIPLTVSERLLKNKILPNDEKINPNIIELNGFVCKEPIFRTTPFKREICDVLLAVNRAYNKSDYIPCIAWGRNAHFVKELKIGEALNIVGRIQSREYQKKLSDDEIESKVAYEI